MPQKSTFPSNGRYLQVRELSNPKVLSLNSGLSQANGTTDRRSGKLLLIPSAPPSVVGDDLLSFVNDRRFGAILADPPWQFQNRTGKVAPEHKRLSRYGTMSLDDIKNLPVADVAAETAHLYLWVPNALLPDGIAVMRAWGFQYKSNLVWHKVRKDGGSDGRGVGFYFRNVTELILFGVRGKHARTLAP